ncbi:hypothetical protein DOTSEDRAFT_70752 [Dothistroma septosporum NZE10]|uniref:Uncharacterized protein n=1 Tax=Dothistroma septosporum (strain NZE10 / CBS 128990) TaxID=675120 RepID=N1PU45_DOTSN|nr:hypothetical protein DOTSEDRAFT_70752 [Dothistroma septosporum NZE10]
MKQLMDKARFGWRKGDFAGLVGPSHHPTGRLYRKSFESKHLTNHINLTESKVSNSKSPRSLKRGLATSRPSPRLMVSSHQATAVTVALSVNASSA